MSTMLRNTRVLAKEMSDSNLSYAKALQAAFAEVQKNLERPGSKFSILAQEENALVAKSNRDFLSKRKPGQRPEKTKRKREKPPDSPSMDSFPEKPDSVKVEKWAKALYRSIIIQTHPDKVNNRGDWSALKKETYVQIGLEAVDCYQARDYAGLISAGCEIGVFSQQLSVTEQMKLLNEEYTSQIKSIDEVQESLAWKWGSFWASDSDRVLILQSLCVKHGFQPPPNDQLLEILKKIDLFD